MWFREVGDILRLLSVLERGKQLGNGTMSILIRARTARKEANWRIRQMRAQYCAQIRNLKIDVMLTSQCALPA